MADDKASESNANTFKSLADGFEKKLGKGAMTRASSIDGIKTWVSTGSLALDYILSGRCDGTGGLPAGRIVEMFGDPSTGKSSLAYHILAETQRIGGACVLIDAEGAYDKDFGEKLGVDNELMFVQQPKKNKPVSCEQVFDIVQETIDSSEGELVTVIWDSLAYTSTEHEIKVGIRTPDMSKAKVIKAGMRQIGHLTQSQVLFVVLNHLIDNIGVQFGPKKVTPGGGGTPFAASARLMLSKGKDILAREPRKGEKKINVPIVGVETRAYVQKSKVFPPFGRAVIEIHWDKGVDRYSGLIDLLVAEGCIDAGGGWFKYDGENYRKDDLVQLMKDNPEMLESFGKVKV